MAFNPERQPELIRTEHRPRVEITGPTGPVLFLVAAFLLAFAPLIRGGNRPLPLMILEAAGLLGLGALIWSRSAGELRASVPPMAGWGIAILTLAPLVQMIPLPGGWWRLLPGHEDYARVLDLTQSAIDSGFRPLSMHARATEYSCLALIPCLAMFFLVQALERRQLRQLVRIFPGGRGLRSDPGHDAGRHRYRFRIQPGKPLWRRSGDGHLRQQESFCRAHGDGASGDDGPMGRRDPAAGEPAR